MLDGSEEEDVFEEEAGTSVVVPPTYRVTVQIDYDEGEPVNGKRLYFNILFN